jgi:TadE-like protein
MELPPPWGKRNNWVILKLSDCVIEDLWHSAFWFSITKLLQLLNDQIQQMKVRLQKLRNIEAAEIAEAALVMPVVFLFLLGIIWFGRAFNIYSTITQAAQQGAITAARPTCATCPAPGTPWGSTNFPGDTAVASAVISVMQASNLDPAQIVSVTGSAAPGCTAPSNILVCREVVLNLSPPSQPQQCAAPQESQVCGTTVSFQYPFQFYLPFTSLNMTRVILNAQAQSRMEN